LAAPYIHLLRRSTGSFLRALGRSESCEAHESQSTVRVHAALKKVGYDGWLVAEMEERYRYALD